MNRRPNFIVFLTDDQGYADLGCMGSEFVRTPGMDRIAETGVRFTSWYSNSPVCSPSRASLLTGRHPGNAGVRSILAGHRTASGLPTRVPTIATALRDLGYRTAMSGKWHLGLSDGCRPLDHGFDHWYGFLAGCVDYYSHIFYWGMNTPGPGINPTHDLWDDDRETWENGEYLTERITVRALGHLRSMARSDNPFFLYVAYNAPHYPMHAPAHAMDRFADLPWDRRVMAAMLSVVDDGVGAILDELDRLGIADDTVVLFTADNGPSRESRNWLDGNLDPYYGGTTGRLRGHKFSLFEGGIRVPGLLRWPARIPAGRVCHDPAASMDIFPTLLRAAGGDPSAYEIDGRDLAPMLTEDAVPPGRDLAWEMNDQRAIRRGPWKLVVNGRLVETEPPAAAVHLANLDDDPGERVNLADREPRIATEMREAVDRWHADIEDRWRREYDPSVQGTTGRTTESS